MKILAILLVAVSTLIVSDGVQAQTITWSELYDVAQGGKELSQAQKDYLWVFLGTAVAADSISWKKNKHGLFCPPPHVSLDPEDLLPVVLSETHSDHGWVYADSVAVAPQLMDALASHYECTPESETALKKQFCEPLPGGVPNAMCDLVAP